MRTVLRLASAVGLMAAVVAGTSIVASAAGSTTHVYVNDNTKGTMPYNKTISA